MLHDYDRPEIDSLRLDWVRFMNAGDASRIGSLFTPAAVWIPRGEPALEGWNAISRWLETIFAAYQYQMSVMDPALRFAGNWAVERARFRAILAPMDGSETSTHDGGYIIVWRRGIDENWAIDRYIDDSE
ncbi:MAG: nuclear transport factor 2 family protein [Chloroflexi bacterium]|nr:nuclear transport factor 2 family protein [Chloroflexota bacterium]